MDGVKSEPEVDSDRGSASPRYEPQFVKVKEEQMAEEEEEGDDDDDKEEETVRGDDDLGDPPEEETAEAVMFPIVKTEYHTDTSQRDVPEEGMFGTVTNESKVRFILHVHQPLLQHVSPDEVHELKCCISFFYDVTCCIILRALFVQY
jgi:hypothetical protein